MKCEMLFTGDIMAQIAQNEACKTETGWDYSPVLAGVRGYLKAADMTVGNMETPFAGEAAKYSFMRYSFNTPEQMAYQTKEDGFSLVSMANNHCMDRNIEGLFHTLDVLDEVGLPNTGLFRAPRRPGGYMTEVNGMKFGFLSYTYGTNAFAHHMFLPEGAEFAVNLIQPEETLPGAIDLLDCPNVAPRTEALYHQPNPLFDQQIAPRLNQLEADVRALREDGAEAVVLLLHCGGQRDPEPDAYTREVIRRVTQLPLDAVIVNHQHILHPFSVENGVPVAWCLGNLIQTPAEMELPGLGSAYSALLRVTWEKTDGLVRPVAVYARLTRSIIDEAGRTVVVTLKDLIDRANAGEKEKLLFARDFYVRLLRRQAEDAPVEDADEYLLWEMK